MSKIASLLTLLSTALVFLLSAAPVDAAAGRTFVSAAGSDSNNCTNVATPCRHLATAYAATAANGEIYVLDPANYGSLTITGPVSIEGHGWASIAPPSGTNTAAITINANAGDKINIIGVVLDGTALAGTSGIQFNSGGALNVQDSVIRDFTNDGIYFAPNASSSSQLFVSRTLVSDNGLNGINIVPTGSGTTISVLDSIRMESNVHSGLNVVASNQIINVTLNDCVSAGNSTNGVRADSTGGTTTIMVRKSTITYNNDGLNATGSGAAILVTRSAITGNTNGWVTASSGVVLSYGDNNIDGNTNVNSEPPNPLVYQ